MSSTYSDILRKIYDAKEIFAIRHLFLSILIQDYRIELSEEVETAVLDFNTKRIVFNPDFARVLIGEKAEKIPAGGGVRVGEIFRRETVPNDLLFVFAHEAFHHILLAKDRAILKNIEPGSREWKIWNMAQDYVINIMIEDLGIAKMLKGYYYDESVPPGQRWNKEGRGEPVDFLYDPKYRGWTTEEVYEDLLKKSLTKQQKPIDEVYGIPRNKEEARGFYRELEDKIIKARGLARVPSELERIIDEILRPKLDWRTLLSRYMKFYIMGSGRSDYTWYPPHKKRYSVLGIYLPGMYERAVRAVVAIDTSGSITKEEFIDFVSEVQGIMSAFTNYELLVIVCDDHIETRNRSIVDDELILYVPDRDDYIILKDRRSSVPPGFWRQGGGTDYNPVFKLVERLYFRPDVLVYFTDLECDMSCVPDVPPPYPVIWVSTQPEREAFKPPFGEIIYYSRHETEFTYL